jgi:hypothetical protein
MRSFVKELLALASLIVPVFARPALAQEPQAGQPAAAAKASAPPEAGPEPKPSPNAAPSASPGLLEWMPPSAYPETRKRGFYGGSLWLGASFHGLQWPYYPKTGIGVAGYGWVDTGYEHVARGESLRGSPGNPQEPSSTYWLQQGRLVLRVTPTWSDGNYFVQGQAELVADHDQTVPLEVANVDDMWLKVGKWRLWDLQVGRFEAWEVYHFGMGLDLNTLERIGASDPTYGAPAIYGLTFAFYRPASPLGQAALHLYPTDWLRFEVGTEFGTDSVQGAVAGANAVAARPVGIVDFTWLKLKVGAEYKELTGQNDGAKQDVKQQGYGGAIQIVLDPYVEFGVNGAYATQEVTAQDGTPNATASYFTYSLGAFANARVIDDLLVGAGLDYTYKRDKQFDMNLGRNEDFDHWQTFGAIQYLLFHQLFIKGVFAYALADFSPNMNAPVFKNEMVSGRLRLMYLF